LPASTQVGEDRELSDRGGAELARGGAGVAQIGEDRELRGRGEGPNQTTARWREASEVFIFFGLVLP
jgi:hypothetical protein